MRDINYKVVGAVFTILVHGTLLGVGFCVGLNNVSPLPVEQGILIDFSEPEPIPEEKPVISTGTVEPKAKDAEPENEIKLVQKSEAPVTAEKSTHGEETTVSPEGDVEVPEPPRKEIKKRALFSSSNNKKDTIAPQAADKPSDKLVAGHIDGNATQGNVTDAPQALLEGRTLEGHLPQPSYGVQKSGKVVVEIHVDNYGKVIKAKAVAIGTTVTDKKLWEAAEKAAYDAKFNISETAPATQKGTITYIFQLR